MTEDEKAKIGLRLVELAVEINATPTTDRAGLLRLAALATYQLNRLTGAPEAMHPNFRPSLKPIKS